MGIARVQGVGAGGLLAVSITGIFDEEEHTSEDRRFEKLHKLIDLNQHVHRHFQFSTNFVRSLDTLRTVNDPQDLEEVVSLLIGLGQ